MLRWYNMSARFGFGCYVSSMFARHGCYVDDTSVRYGCYDGCMSVRHGLAKKLGKLECKDFLAASNKIR